MYTLRALGNPPSSPPFRAIDYANLGALVLVSTHLRHAWTAAPPPAGSAQDDIGAFIAASHNRSVGERALLPQEPNKNDVTTPWRQRVLHGWHHVLYEVGGFLAERRPAGSDVGAHGGLIPVATGFGGRSGVVALEYEDGGGSGSAGGNGGRGVLWDTDVLVAPVFLEAGVELRMVAGEGAEERTLGIFVDGNGSEMWYLRRGLRIKFFVEGEFEDVRGGVAVVLVYGRLEAAAGGSGRSEVRQQEEDEEDEYYDGESEDESEGN